MKVRVIRTLLVMLAGAGVALCGEGLRGRAVTRPLDLSTAHTLTVQDVRSLSVLLSNQVEVADVCITRVDGYLGGAQVAVLVRGQVDLGVDLDAATFVEVDSDRHSATLVLPAPKVFAATIDHERTRIVALVYSGLWQLNPQPAAAMSLVDRSLGDTQRLLTQIGSGQPLNTRSRRQIESVIEVWGRSLQWSVRIRWADTPDRV